MAIGGKFGASLRKTDKLNREIPLGYHPSVIIKFDGEDENGECLKDNLGEYFWMILKQVDTGMCTASGAGKKDETNRQLGRKDVIKIHMGEAGYNKAGYAQQEGWGYKKFFKAIEGQHPELKKLAGWEEELHQLQRYSLKVWYTRNDRGYLNAHFSEQDYQYAVQTGAQGADQDELTPDESRTLNEDAPF